MGGKTFPDLNVPRMSPELYKQISTECQSKLETIFDRVVVPRDAPNKADYGDIDYLVDGHTLSEDDIWNRVKNVLKADVYKLNGHSSSFALPHPDISGGHVQVDVELSPGDGTPVGPELFEWIRFMKADADLMQIISILHRALGLTCNDKGLHVRIEEIEPYNKKKALLFLTRDPDKAMKFFGLDTSKYRAGFTNEIDLFDWVTNGRFFAFAIFECRSEKSSDRSRHAKRPMYARFVDEYMPANTDKNDSYIWTRQEVLEEALKTFDKRAEYDEMIADNHSRKGELALWSEIRTVLPIESKSSQDYALKGLRRWTIFQDGRPNIATEINLDGTAIWTKLMAPGTRACLLAWVLEHWEEAKALEKARANASRTAALNTWNE